MTIIQIVKSSNLGMTVVMFVTVPIMRTPGVKKALILTNEKLRRSSQVKTQVTRYAYNDYMVHHYAFVMKVAAEQETERPSLCHRLEGENSLNRTKPQRRNKTAKNRATKPRRADLPRKAAKKNASLSTDFTTTHNAGGITDSTISIRIDADSGTLVEADFGYRPKPTRLELEGAC